MNLCPAHRNSVGSDKFIRKEVKKMKKKMEKKKLRFFQLQNSQSGAPDGDPIEAENLKEVQTQVLLQMGLELVEVDENGEYI